MALISFMLGTALALPPLINHALLALVSISCISLISQSFRWLLLGFLLCLLHNHHDLSRFAQLNKPVTVSGQISSVVLNTHKRIQFDLSLMQIDGNNQKGTLRVNWYRPKLSLQAGNIIEAKVKIRLPRNFANPGVFNYKLWMFSQRKIANAYIYRDDIKVVNTSGAGSFLTIRQFIANKIINLNTSESVKSIVLALTLGVKGLLSNDTRRLLFVTGTSHLLAISGLHVGMIAGLVFLLVNYAVRLFPLLCLLIPAQRIAAILSIIVAVWYAGLAGFSLPTQRALIMLIAFLQCYLWRSTMTSWHSLLLACWLVLLIEPNSLLMPGFYLSFGAVIVILLFNQLIISSKWIKVLWLQLMCVLCMAPLTIFWFSYSSAVAVIANLIAIPVVGFIIVPLCLCFVIVILFNQGGILLFALQFCIDSFLRFLSDLSQHRHMIIPVHHLDSEQLLLCYLVLLCVFLLPFYRLKLISLFLLWPLFKPVELITHGQMKLSVLDVGQGLAVLVQTTKHQLLYDTGTRFLSGRDMGELVVKPVLLSKRIKSLDKIIISHTDLDHRGGLVSLVRSVAVGQILVNKPQFYQKEGIKTTSCQDNIKWQWDGVNFEVIPIKSIVGENNQSCVLKISNRYKSLLLTGDIEYQAEQYLTKYYGKKIASTAMSVPHHGSRSSSSSTFLNEVNPHLAFNSSGYHNRYHFPHEQVIKRYKNKGVSFYNTAYCGMISWLMTNNPLYHAPKCYRKS